MKIAFIGIGNVGFAIANILQKAGNSIIIANNNFKSDSVKSAIQKNSAFLQKTVQDAVNDAEIIFLVTPFSAIAEVLSGVKFSSKILVDCTNPIGIGLTHSLKSAMSGAEYVQELATDAKVIKAFSIYGYENFVNNQTIKDYPKPVMLIAGNDQKSKNDLSKLIEPFGFFTKDAGDLSQALHLEHMTLLWIKMARDNSSPKNFMWAYLEY
jgi:predicted dinucleotide-binding enzyme